MDLYPAIDLRAGRCVRLVEGDFGFVDSARRRMRGTRKLVAEMTLREGRVVWDLNGMNSEDWNASK